MEKSINQRIVSFINYNHPNEKLVIFTGSLSVGAGNANSDIDLLILTNLYFYPFTSKTLFEGMDFHCKVVPLNKIIELMYLERATESPVLVDMVLKGTMIIEKTGDMNNIKEIARMIYACGSYPLTPESEQKYLINIERNLDVLVRPIPFEEKIYIVSELLNEFTTYLLLKNNKWPYTPKRRFEQMEKYFPGLSSELSEHLKKAAASNETQGLSSLINKHFANYGKLVHYYNSKIVDEVKNHSNSCFGIYFSGVSDTETFLEISAQLLQALKNGYKDFYFYHTEDIRNKNPSYYYLVLLGVNTNRIQDDLVSLRNSFIHKTSNINLIYPNNQIEYLHDQKFTNPIFSDIHLASKHFLIKTIAKDKAYKNIPLCVIKLIALLLKDCEENTTLLIQRMFEKWLPASIDYSNSFNVVQILNRKEWISEAFQNSSEQLIKGDKFIEYLSVDDEIHILSNQLKHLFQLDSNIPLWFISEENEPKLIKIDFIISIVLDSFLIHDKQRAFILYTIARIIKQELKLNLFA